MKSIDYSVEQSRPKIINMQIRVFRCAGFADVACICEATATGGGSIASTVQ